VLKILEQGNRMIEVTQISVKIMMNVESCVDCLSHWDLLYLYIYEYILSDPAKSSIQGPKSTLKFERSVCQRVELVRKLEQI